MRSILSTLALLGMGLLAAGCDGNEGRTDPPNTSIQVIHAAPSLGPVTFRRVQANQTPLDFGQGTTFSWDVDTYSLHFDVLEVDGTVSQTISTQATLVEESAYFLVLREVGGQPQPLLIERPATIQSGGSEVEILHAATTLNAADLYLEVDNFDLTMATPRSSVDFDDLVTVDSLADGTYELVLTDVGNSANVIFDSEPFGLGANSGLFFVIVDGAGTGLSPLMLALGDIDGTTLSDRNSQAAIRVINALEDRATINIGVDNQLMPPLIPGLAPGSASTFELIAPGDRNLSVETTLTPGTLEIDEPFVAGIGRYQTWLVTGNTGSMLPTLFDDDFRVVPGESKLRVYHGSEQTGIVNVFVVAPGTDITTIPPTVGAARASLTLNTRIAPGNYEITVTEQSTGAVLAGPIAETIAADGYYGILITDAAAGTGIEVTLLFDF